MTKKLEFNHPTVIFGQQFSFTNPETLEAAYQVALDCETVQEFKSILNAEEVLYQASTCKLITA